MTPTLNVLGICGSLRKLSFNRGLLEAALELAPEGMRITRFERLGDIPVYDQDIEDAGVPEPVTAFKDAIRGADALLIATPEYNYGVPGGLKNAIDWASRPSSDTPLKGKPAAILGASPGAGGTIRCQLQLRQAFLFTETHVLLKPEFALGRCKDKFDEKSRLADADTRDRVRKLLEALAAWTVKIR